MSDCLLFQCLVAELWFAPSSQSSPVFNRGGHGRGREQKNKNKQPARDNKRAAAAVLLRLILIGRRRRGGGTEQRPGKNTDGAGSSTAQQSIRWRTQKRQLAFFFDVYETNFCKFSTSLWGEMKNDGQINPAWVALHFSQSAGGKWGEGGSWILIFSPNSRFCACLICLQQHRHNYVHCHLFFICYTVFIDTFVCSWDHLGLLKTVFHSYCWCQCWQ